MNYQAFDPSVSAEFNDCPNGSCAAVQGFYWTSSSYAASPAAVAWIVYFGHGDVLTTNKTTEPYLVRAVRGGL